MAANFRRGADAPIAINLSDDDDDEYDGQQNISSSNNVARSRSSDPPDSSVLEVPSTPTGGRVWDQSMIDAKTRDINEDPDEVQYRRNENERISQSLSHDDGDNGVPVVQAVPTANFHQDGPREPSSLRASIHHRTSTGSGSNTSGERVAALPAGKRNYKMADSNTPHKPGLRTSNNRNDVKPAAVVRENHWPTARDPEPTSVDPPLDSPPSEDMDDVDIESNQSAKDPQQDVIVAEATLVKPQDQNPNYQSNSSPNNSGGGSDNNNKMIYMMTMIFCGFVVVIVVVVVVAVLVLQKDDNPSSPSPVLPPTPAPVLPQTSAAPEPATPVPTVVSPVEAPTVAPTNSPVETNSPTTAPVETNNPTTTTVETDSPTTAPVETDSPTTAPVATEAPTAAPVATDPPTEAPTTTPVPDPTPRPSPSPTTSTPAPTATNSANTANAPTQGGFPASLPNFTQVALQTENSPQSQALTWLNRHPAYVTMPNWKRQQLFAMVSFYYGYNGDNWSDQEKEDWLSYTVDECDWGESFAGGNECNADGRITKMTLDSQNDNRAQGTTAPELALLTSLTTFEIYTNNLFTDIPGVLPRQMASLTELENVRLTFNDMTGSIPGYIANFQQLTSLNLRQNEISGAIPTEFGLMTNLRFLTLYSNSLTGTVPTVLASMTSLSSFLIYGNDLTGTFPTVVCEMAQLTSLQIDCEKIVCPAECSCECKDPDEDEEEGPAPTQVVTGAPAATPLTAAPTVDGDYILGVPEYSVDALAIPASPQSVAYEWLSNHPDLETMPEWRKQQLFALVSFFYSFNGNGWSSAEKRDWRSYDIPECEWGDTGTNAENLCDSEGRYLELSIEGTSSFIGAAMPPEMGLLTSLNLLRLSNLELAMDLPSLLPVQLGDVPLKTLFLQFNELSGSIPSHINRLQSLQNLNLNRNQLTGTLPTELGELQNLRFMTLYSNSFTGPIPSEIGLITTLESILLDRTEVTGTMPQEICALTGLNTLRVDCALVTCPDDCGCACYVDTT